MTNLLALLLPAMILVESGGNDWAIGDGGLARGALQIHACYVQDVNAISGTQYGHAHAHIRTAALNMARVYLMHYGQAYERDTGRLATVEVLARIHNGGPHGWRKEATERYWRKVEAVLR